jgi:type I restriction enzyme S subunit
MYKDSGIEWLGKVPEHWKTEKPTRMFALIKGIKAAILTKEYISENPGDYPVYSGQTENNGLMGSIDWFDFDFDSPIIFITTVGAKAMTTRVVSGKFSLSQNCALAIPKNITEDAKFYEYAFQRLFDYEKGSISLIMQPSLRFEDFGHFYVPQPNYEEQQAIASFLDRETARLDALIQKKERMIELLKEKRIALITQAVTKGLNPNAKLKDSGIEWLGEVPEHWEVKRLKRVCTLAYGDSLSDDNRNDGRIHVYGSNGNVGCHDVSNTYAPSIIVGRKGSYGKLNFAFDKAFAIDTTYYIDSRTTASNIRWLFYVLMCLKLDE